MTPDVAPRREASHRAAALLALSGLFDVGVRPSVGHVIGRGRPPLPAPVSTHPPVRSRGTRPRPADGDTDRRAKPTPIRSMTDDTEPDDTDAPPWADELLDNQRELIEATEDLADAVREHYG